MLLLFEAIEVYIAPEPPGRFLDAFAGRSI